MTGAGPAGSGAGIDPSDAPASAIASDPTPLPGDDQSRRHRLPRRSLTYRWCWGVVLGLAVSAALFWGAAALSWFTPEIRWIVAGLVAFYLLPVRLLVVEPLSWRRFWYAVSPDEIDAQSGVFLLTRTVVPMNRVQHLKVTHGPVADRFRVATVHIHTAAGTVTLADLDATEADGLRARISELAGLANSDDDV